MSTVIASVETATVLAAAKTITVMTTAAATMSSTIVDKLTRDTSIRSHMNMHEVASTTATSTSSTNTRSRERSGRCKSYKYRFIQFTKYKDHSCQPIKQPVLRLLDQLINQSTNQPVNQLKTRTCTYTTYSLMSRSGAPTFCIISLTISFPRASHSLRFFIAYVKYSSLDTPNTPHSFSLRARGMM
jgi:hypothetical protein